MAYSSSARHLFFATHGLVRRCYTPLTVPVYELGDLRSSADEVLAQLLERNG